MPPLRARQEDIPLLAAAFLERHAAANRKSLKGFTPQAMDAMLRYSWPGNVRELENAVERAVVLLFGSYVTERELPQAVTDAYTTGTAAPDVPTEAGTLEDMERAFILRTLQESGDNKSEAAKRLGISRKTLHNKLKAYGLHGGPDEE